jgi:hypothetical protein
LLSFHTFLRTLHVEVTLLHGPGEIVTADLPGLRRREGEEREEKGGRREDEGEDE